MLEEKIKRFEHLLLVDRVSGVRKHEKELRELFIEIVRELGKSYSGHRKYFPIFLNILEQHQTEATLYGIVVFQSLYKSVFRDLKIIPFDVDFLDHETDVDLAGRANDELERLLVSGKTVRISDCPLDLSSFTREEKDKIAAAYIHVLENQITISNWEKLDFETTHMLLLPLHQVLKETGRSEMFFYNIGSLLDKFATTEIFQQARNLAEETIIIGFQEDWPDLGYWVDFRVYAGCHNPLGALLSGCVSLLITYEKRTEISDQRAFDILWQSIRLFRNIGLANLAIELYEAKPAELGMNDYRRRTFAHTYFTCLQVARDKRLPDLVLDFLHTEREAILSSGRVEAKPWLILLWQIQKDHPDADFSLSGLGFYLQVFSSMIPAEDVQNFRDLISADNENVIDQLKESIIKLRSTSYRSDFIYDNDAALTKSNRVLHFSATNQNATGFLLAMLIKSDFSILFESKEMPAMAPFRVPEVDVTELDQAYDDPAKLMTQVIATQYTAMIWLGIEEDKLHQLTYFDGQFNFNSSAKWNPRKFRSLVSSHYFANLTFDDTIKQGGQVWQLFEEDYLKERTKVAAEVDILQIEVPEKAEALYLVKDITLSEFPHQLFLDQNGNFIAEKIPVTNVLSTEWLKEQTALTLKPDVQKAIWIPIESNDFTLQMLSSNIEQTLQAHHFFIDQSIKPTAPISAAINIACAHGAGNISDLELIQFGEQLSIDMERFIGMGKVLILFICHSGSATNPLFRNETANLIKKFIANGYEAVIAPAWALHIKVPEIWLPEFLGLLENGLAIDAAVFGANKKVYDLFPTPAAWAALHLYGNPNIKIAQA